MQSTVRTCTADAVVGGTAIAKDEMVFVIIAAANRDPGKFTEPARFDITRTPNDHLSFGEGIHFCLGAGLARLEGAIAIGSALERFPHLRLENPGAPPVYRGSYILRGLKSLPMTIG